MFHFQYQSRVLDCVLLGIFLQYFADRDIFCAGRVAEEDLNRVAAAAGGTVQTSVNNIIDEVREKGISLFAIGYAY